MIFFEKTRHVITHIWIGKAFEARPILQKRVRWDIGSPSVDNICVDNWILKLDHLSN